MKNEMNLETFALTTVRNGGATYSLQWGNVSGLPFYSCAIGKETEKRFSGIFSRAELSAYISEHSELLASDRYALGAWVDEGVYYLDIVQLLEKRAYSKEMAVNVGRERQQIAIFDLEYSECIYC
jgi:hypothetical protein